MTETDLFGAYVRTRLEGWGREFADRKSVV